MMNGKWEQRRENKKRHKKRNDQVLTQQLLDIRIVKEGIFSSLLGGTSLGLGVGFISSLKNQQLFKCPLG